MARFVPVTAHVEIPGEQEPVLVDMAPPEELWLSATDKDDRHSVARANARWVILEFHLLPKLQKERRNISFLEWDKVKFEAGEVVEGRPRRRKAQKVAPAPPPEPWTPSRVLDTMAPSCDWIEDEYCHYHGEKH
jgi:hypothetical protein